MPAPGKSELLSAAFARLRAGDRDGAAEALTEALISDPGDERVRLELAEVLVVLGRTEEAVSLLHSVALRCAGAGIHEEARHLFERVLALDRSRVDVRLELALLYRRLGHLPESYAHYRDAARLYDERGQVAESLDAWCKLLELCQEEELLPSYEIAARVEQAETMARAGFGQRALEGLSEVVERLDGEGRTAELAQILEGIVLLDPSDTANLRRLAQLRLDERDRPERALAALQSAFRFDPQDLLTLELLAFAFMVLGEHAKAMAVRREILPVYERGVAADAGPAPADPHAGKLWEVDVFLRYGLSRRALAHARAFVRLLPFRVEARLKLHEAYLACGSVDGAVNELLAAIDLAVLSSRPDDARRALALGFAAAPGHPALREKRAELGIPESALASAMNAEPGEGGDEE